MIIIFKDSLVKSSFMTKNMQKYIIYRHNLRYITSC
jgi:hypothetical protein